MRWNPLIGGCLTTAIMDTFLYEVFLLYSQSLSILCGATADSTFHGLNSSLPLLHKGPNDSCWSESQPSVARVRAPSEVGGGHWINRKFEKGRLQHQGHNFN